MERTTEMRWQSQNIKHGRSVGDRKKLPDSIGWINFRTQNGFLLLFFEQRSHSQLGAVQHLLFIRDCFSMTRVMLFCYLCFAAMLSLEKKGSCFFFPPICLAVRFLFKIDLRKNNWIDGTFLFGCLRFIFRMNH